MAPKLNTDAEVLAFIKSVHGEVLQRHNEEKADALREALTESRDAVLSSATIPAPRHFDRRLPSSGEATNVSDLLLCRPCKKQENAVSAEGTQPDEAIGGAQDEAIGGAQDAASAEGTQPNEAIGGVQGAAVASSANNNSTRVPILPSVSVVFQNPKGPQWTTTHPAIPLEGTHEPRPTGSTPAFLKMHFATEDERALSYVPYFGDEDRDNGFLELYDTAGRERMMEVGPDYREREMHRVIKDTLQLADERLGGRARAKSEGLQKRLEAALAALLKIDADLIHNREEQQHVSTPASAKKPPPKSPYLGAVDSYRECFCRRCSTYDCNIHQCLSKPDIEIQTELALEKERAGVWKGVSEGWCGGVHVLY